MPSKWLVLIAVSCGTFMATLDASIVNIALHTLTQHFGETFPHVKWIVIAYFLMITCLLLPIGRAADHYGRKRIFMFGFFLFAFGSLLCGIAPSLIWMVFSRMLQATGAAMLMANGPALIVSSFPTRERGKALGFLAMVVSVGLISGPSLGGILIVKLGWQSIFLVNIPIAIMGIYLAHKHIVSDATSAKEPFAFDWLGALLQSITLISLMFAFDASSLEGLHSLPMGTVRTSFFLTSGIAALIFLQVERKIANPLLDLELIKNKAFWTANLSAFLTFVAYSSVAVIMPYFLEVSLGMHTDEAGLYMAAVPLAIFFIAPLSGRLSDVYGSRGLCILGALIEAVSLLAMSGVVGTGLTDQTAKGGLVLGLCLIGIGMGLFQTPNNNAVMAVVLPQKLGVASALIATVRNLGLVIGTGLVTELFSWQIRLSGDYTKAIHFTYLISGIIALGAMIVSASKPKGRHWD